jgi:hypothetical protein
LGLARKKKAGANPAGRSRETSKNVKINYEKLVSEYSGAFSCDKNGSLRKLGNFYDICKLRIEHQLFLAVQRSESM